ncbi:MAG: M24 family metallopeptidase [Bythopirellula sp.]
MTRIAKRRDKIRARLRREKLDGLLITNPINVAYLTGFTGEDSYLLMTPKQSIVLSDERFTTQLQEECPDLELAIRGPGLKMLKCLAKTVTQTKVKKLGFEKSSLTVALHSILTAELSKVNLIGADGWVEQQRMIKDRDEIARTRVACDLARRAFEVVRATLMPDMTERQVAADLEYQARRFGGKCMSFPSIVAVGPRAALPHAQPTNQRLDSDAFLLIDWGVNEELYMSDLTRILVTAKISPKLRKIYNLVLKAQLAGIKAIRPGITCEAVDRAARNVIAKAGYGKNFGHGLGHGTGLEIHEAPRLASGQGTVLKPGMIVTVEPGIYLPGWGGVRIEDDVLVTRDGHEVLSKVPKQLDECIVM